MNKPLKTDKAYVAQRFEQAKDTYLENAVVQQEICKKLTSYMQVNDVLGFKKRIFEIGCGAGSLSTLMFKNTEFERYYLNDLYKSTQIELANTENIEWYIGDIENITFPQNLDLIVSSSALQWVDDIDAVFQQSAAALNEQGLLCFSTFGTENLKEIKSLTGQGLVYLSTEKIKNKLDQAGFEILLMKEDKQFLYFNHPKLVLQHLRATGVTGIASDFRWTKASLQQFYEGYKAFSTLQQGVSQYPLTYHPIYCIARRKLNV